MKNSTTYGNPHPALAGRLSYRCQIHDIRNTHAPRTSAEIKLTDSHVFVSEPDLY